MSGRLRVSLRYWTGPDEYGDECVPWSYDWQLPGGHRRCGDVPHRDIEDWTLGVYEAYDRDGRPLYVGKSARVAKRLNQHRLSSGWWNDLASVVITRIPCKRQQHRFERIRIRDLRPAHNKANNPDWLYRTGRSS